MDREIASKLNVLINDKVMKRKAMFLPLFAISAFGVVGYAAADREAPKILSNKVQVLYGTNLSAKDFEITDNRDKAEDLDVRIDTTTFDKKQLGTYNVNVEAADQFNNTTSKVVEVEVVDKEAPVITPKNSGGYVIDVNANGSNKLEDYIKAVDNVDGDVTPFITADKELDTTKVGVQTINVTASDNAGNTTTKALQFAVSDKEAPTVSYKNGDHVTVAYGSQFNIADYLNIADNLDTNPKVETEGNVDTSKEGTYSIKAKVSDANGNSAQPVALTVEVKDITAPTITLSKSSVEFLEGSAFNARSYLSNASDNKDGDVTGKVQINSNVNASKAGSYTVTYTVSDNAGNKASKSLKFKYWWDHIAPTIKFQNPEGRELPADLGTVKYPATIQNTIKMYVADNDTSSPEITVSIRGTLNGKEILNQRLNHSTLKTNVFNLANVDLQNKAVYTITATAKDQFGNSASKTVTFKYWKDIVAPTVKILNSAGKETADLGTIAFPAKFTDYFKVEASDDQTANPQVTTTVSGTGLRKTLAGSCANKVCTYSDNTQLTDSTVYTIEAVAVDDFGNQTKKTAKFNYKDDLVPPTVEFLSTSGSQITQLGNVEYPAVYTEFFRIRVADNVDKNPQLTAKFSLANGSQSVVLQPKRVSDGVYIFLPHSTAELKDKTEYMITAVAKDQRGLTTTKTIKFTYRGDMTKPNIHLADLKNLGRTLSSQLGEIVFPTEFTDVAGVTVFLAVSSEKLFFRPSLPMLPV